MWARNSSRVGVIHEEIEVLKTFKQFEDLQAENDCLRIQIQKLEEVVRLEKEKNSALAQEMKDVESKSSAYTDAIEQDLETERERAILLDKMMKDKDTRYMVDVMAAKKHEIIAVAGLKSVEEGICSLSSGIHPEAEAGSRKTTQCLDSLMASVEATIAVSQSPAPDSKCVISLEERLTQIKVLCQKLRLAIQLICAFLWPGEPMPNNLYAHAKQLELASEKSEEWNWSSARAGAETALRLVPAWYKNINLSRLELGHPKEVPDHAALIPSVSRIDNFVACKPYAST